MGVHPRRLALVGLAVASTLASCAGSSSGAASPARWTATFCQSTLDWGRAIKKVSTDVGAAFSAGDVASVASAKQEIANVLDASISATDRLIAAITRAGRPDVPKGSEVQSAVLSAFADSKQLLVDARTQAADLRTDSPAAFARQAATIGGGVETGFRGVGQALGSLKRLDANHAIERAGNKQRACRELESL